MTEKVLPYDKSVVPQEKSWDCGPASTQVVLNSRGIIMSEDALISQIGTTVNGTDYVGLIERVLDRVTADATYTSVYLEQDPISQSQKDQLWSNIVQSINAGYGVVMNWVSPPGNHPKAVKGSVTPNYGNGTIFHYVPCMGYDDNPNARAVFIADPGFQPFGYWISFDQCATLIPPKGYCYAATGVAPPVAKPDNLAALLSAAMGDRLTPAQYSALLPYFCDALVKANCTNNNRIAMFAAELGEESGGLQWMEEIASGSEYEGRTDLGNSSPGDGVKYKGRGPIQVTGKNNYARLGQWAFVMGYVPSASYFVNNPTALSDPKYGFLGAIWYWTVAEPDLNGYADAGDVERASKLINMPAYVNDTSMRANGIEDRIARWNRCRAMDLTPLLGGAGEDDDEMAGWTQATVDRAMVLLENTAGILRASDSGFRWPGEGPIDTSVGFGRRADATGHMGWVEKLAVEYGDAPTVGLLLTVAACSDPDQKANFPDRQDDARVAALILAKVSVEAKAAGWDYVAAWLAAEQEASK